MSKSSYFYSSEILHQRTGGFLKDPIRIPINTIGIKVKLPSFQYFLGSILCRISKPNSIVVHLRIFTYNLLNGHAKLFKTH